MSKLEFIDTHCHIHDEEFTKKYTESPEEIIASSKNAGVSNLICVGTDLKSSLSAVSFCKDNKNIYCSLALHPHEAEKSTIKELERQVELIRKSISTNIESGKIVAVGECGLDYFYHKDKDILSRQQELLRLHFELAIEFDLPMIFHVRDAFEDFFNVFDDYKGIKGVVHSFSASEKELKGVIERGLYVGLNGIMTFTKDEKQLSAARKVPENKLILETDAPFLTPVPFRGKICKPEHVVLTAQFLADIRGENLEIISKSSTKNARMLFGI